MGVAPLDQINTIKQEILANKDVPDSRPIRHRVLVELVKQGGWIDERSFGLQVVGDFFRDLKGLLSIAPRVADASQGKFHSRLSLQLVEVRS